MELLTQKRFDHPVQTFQLTSASQEAVLIANEGEPVEGIVGTGAGVKLWGPTHRARNHLSGELWINVLCISWAFLKDKTINGSDDV